MFSLHVDHSSPSSVVVALRGDLDADAATAFTHRVLAVHDGGQQLLLDIGGLEFIDSSGISAILRVRDRVAERGGGLRLLDTPAPVRRVLEITGLLSTLGLA